MELSTYDPGGKVSPSHIFPGNGWAEYTETKQLSHTMNITRGTILGSLRSTRCLHSRRLTTINQSYPLVRVNLPRQNLPDRLPRPDGNKLQPAHNVQPCGRPHAIIIGSPNPSQLSIIEVSQPNPNVHSIALIPIWHWVRFRVPDS